MITKIYTPKSVPIQSTSTSLYKLVAILLTVKKLKKITISKLQVYIWGMQYEENKNNLICWKEQHYITDTPWLIDNNIIAIISQCIANHYLTTETNKGGKVFIRLDCGATTFLNQIAGLELTKELDGYLSEIGNLTDIMLENIEFDF
jgi:hypothetical protein